MTFTPAAVNAAAQAHPVSPPPTMATGTLNRPRCRGYSGRRARGNESRKYGTRRIGVWNSNLLPHDAADVVGGECRFDPEAQRAHVCERRKERPGVQPESP